MKTLREELKDLYDKSMTATEQTNRIIASAKISAEEGMDSIYVWLDKDIYILAEEANTYDTPNRSIEAGIFTDAFIKGYKKANEWISVKDKLPEIYEEVIIKIQKFGDRYPYYAIGSYESNVLGELVWWEGESEFDIDNANHNQITHWRRIL